MLVEQVDGWLSWVTVAANVVMVVGFVVAVRWAKGVTKDKLLPGEKWIRGMWSQWGLLAGLVVAVVATMGSLFYSEVAGYVPCKLCWFQRIFMYAQVPMMALAVGNKDKKVAPYVMTLSGIGGVIALYHYLLQRGWVSEITECSVVGYSASCADNFGVTWGYITIPMMALSAFVLMGVIMAGVMMSQRGKDRG